MQRNHTLVQTLKWPSPSEGKSGVRSAVAWNGLRSWSFRIVSDVKAANSRKCQSNFHAYNQKGRWVISMRVPYPPSILYIIHRRVLSVALCCLPPRKSVSGFFPLTFELKISRSTYSNCCQCSPDPPFPIPTPKWSYAARCSQADIFNSLPFALHRGS